jgi:hypothetical protein
MAEKKDLLQHPADSIFENGYGTVAKKVMQDTTITIEAKAIYAYLCTFMGAGNTAFPSVAKMCFDLQIYKDRFYKHFKLLIDEGYIKKNRVHFNKSGKFANNIYTLVF